MQFEPSVIHADTVAKTDTNHSKGLYYNSAYEIENFIQVYQDSGDGDPFKVLNDPTWTGFKLFFHFDAKTGLLADESNVNSALAYLKRIGQTGRYNLLQRFITVLSKVNSITPWIFQEITGLKELYANKYSDVRIDKEINIKTLETIDGKIMSLVKMYREISYDYERKVHILPINLRRFSMSIYVYDFRMFSNMSKTASELMQTIDNLDVRKLNHTLFDLGYCEFTEDSGADFFDAVTNNRTDANTSNLTIRCEALIVSSLFKSITGDTALDASSFELASVGSTKNLGANINSASDVAQNPSWVSRLKKTMTNAPIVTTGTNSYNELLALDSWKTKLKSTEDTAVTSMVNLAESKLTKLYLGNVHGFALSDLTKIAESSNLGATFNQKYSQINMNQSLANGNSTVPTLGNINTI